jgi:transcriptional regulator GlxA family with amidase domain
MFHGLRNSVSRRDLAREHDFAWLDEQHHQRVLRSIAAWRARQEIAEQFDQVRPGTRRELARRIGWAVDFMLSDLSRELKLPELASAARLSPYHFLRVFKQAHNLTPCAFLRRQRLERAIALLDTTTLPVGEIAARVGLSRLALWRGVRALRGTPPREGRCNNRALVRDSMRPLGTSSS